MQNRAWLLLLASPLLLANQGCKPSETVADKRAREQTETITAAASSAVGMPGITRYNELRLMKMLYELRDQEGLSTITYIVDLNGKLHKLCDSAGFGLPYATQMTNPDRVAQDYTSSFGTLPQPEPNGLFMPDSADASWVMCLDPTTKELSPLYVEPLVIVSRFPLAAVD